MLTSRWSSTPTPQEADRVRALVSAVAAADGVDAFAEPARRDIAALGGAGGRPRSRHLLVHDGTDLVGYALLDAEDLDDPVAELAVLPERRRRGVGAAVVDAVLQESPGARFWAHGDHPGAARLAERVGRRRVRELWRMRRPAPGHEAPPLPELVVPEGVTIDPLRVGRDEDAVVAVNNRAFSWHPEQSGWTRADVAEIEAESWFDAAGVLLAWDTATGDLLGFHFTKVHEVSATVPEPLGEVYVVGVDPAAQGRGLGRALTLAGLHHLAGRGLRTTLLYVEGDNAPAIATYRRLGFERDAVDVSYQR
ncbi:mycothiol synthase [Actinomycetospora lutea]|uniref:mycothiol synthase n=1 Tax=Actinomycetospora lutea TaxID=663604 RepID=UPI00236685A1|nr:mycothiol synthase [Actinomycetospora lutea]MDD7940642.1 mycothiol synthase [Actinomycetospora lutea]